MLWIRHPTRQHIELALREDPFDTTVDTVFYRKGLRLVYGPKEQKAPTTLFAH